VTSFDWCCVHWIITSYPYKEIHNFKENRCNCRIEQFRDNWTTTSFTYVLLTLKSTLVNISATKNTRKQSTVTFKLFVLWLHNQCYYTHDAIGIKITHGDLPYYEGIRDKTRHEYKLHKKARKSCKTFRKCSITWHVLIIGWFTIQWCAQQYTAHVIPIQSNMVGQARIAEVWRKPVTVLRHFIPSNYAFDVTVVI